MGKIETVRLYLRELSNTDIDGLYLLKSDPQVTRNYHQPAMNREQCIKKLNSLIEDISKDQSYTYSAFTKEDGSFIGMVCLWNLSPETLTGEIGYELLPAYWSQGYGKEIIQPFIHHMHREFGYKTFTACPAVENLPSNKVLIRSGFEFERRFREGNHEYNNYIYTIG